MWRSGVSASQVPTNRPSAARRFAEEALASNADESIKHDAEEILNQLDSFPHFMRFADGIGEFNEEFERLRETVKSIVAVEEPQATEAVPLASRKYLVVSAAQHPVYASGPDEDPLFFDSEFNDALGDAIALSSDELTTIIVLSFSRHQSGEYRSKDEHDLGEQDPFGKFAMAAYTHTCKAVLVDWSDGSVVAAREFSADDPPERHLALLGGTHEQDGHDVLRADVCTWIGETASAPLTK
jgi:hypothetical protein